MSVMGRDSWAAWVADYSQSHQNRINRVCHTVGIPLIALSVFLFIAACFVRSLWSVAIGLFVLGWAFQFAGHVFEGKPPEFLKDPRFLLVGMRWWVAKLKGKA